MKEKLKMALYSEDYAYSAFVKQFSYLVHDTCKLALPRFVITIMSTPKLVHDFSFKNTKFML